MSKPEFVYTTYIETSAEKLWQALTDGDFTERYWLGHRVTSDWKAGSPYNFAKQGAPSIEGKVLIVDPLRRLAYSWDSCSPQAQRERTSRVTFDLKVWEALTSTKFSRKYFFGNAVEVELKVGGAYIVRTPDGSLHISGEGDRMRPATQAYRHL
jgi:uncharacterized protein YndB with AHSA1/START domain